MARTEVWPPAAVAGLLLNACVWGLSWWPMRQLHDAGLHPLWATAAIFTCAVAAIGLARPAAWRQLATTPVLWAILVAAGTTNAAFNWGVTAGDVVRVVLLFYVMPVWTVLLSRWLLREPVTRQALLRVALAVGGAALVLWPEAGWRQGLSALQPIDLLGLLGGLSFAVNNVMLRRSATQAGGGSGAGRGLAMFLGGCVVSATLACTLPGVPLPPAPQAGWMLGVAALALCFLASNLALQYGATRLPAQVTSVIMLTEVLWATGSAWALGAGQLGPQVLLGGGLILASAGLAALQR